MKSIRIFWFFHCKPIFFATNLFCCKPSYPYHYLVRTNLNLVNKCMLYFKQKKMLGFCSISIIHSRFTFGAGEIAVAMIASNIK